MIEFRTLKHKDRLYYLEYEKEEADYTVGYLGGYTLISITTEDGRELKNLINSNIEEAIFEELYL